MRKLLIWGTMMAALTGPADASRKPCRDAQGKIIPCPRPSPTPQHRCKDATGRFAPCDHPAPPKN